MASSLVGKLEIDVEIKISAQKFHDMFRNRPHHVSNACSNQNHNIQGCELHKGDWGTQGSIICWSYVHGGEAKIAKEIVEAVDLEKNSITLRVLEGDLINEYKSFVACIQATPKSEGEGSVVHWIFEYEKLHEGAVHLETLLDFTAQISKDIDAHIIQGN